MKRSELENLDACHFKVVVIMFVAVVIVVVALLMVLVAIVIVIKVVDSNIMRTVIGAIFVLCSVLFTGDFQSGSPAHLVELGFGFLHFFLVDACRHGRGHFALHAQVILDASLGVPEGCHEQSVIKLCSIFAIVEQTNLHVTALSNGQSNTVHMQWIRFWALEESAILAQDFIHVITRHVEKCL